MEGGRLAGWGRGGLTVVLLAYATVTPMAALKTAAGGGPSGRNGFQQMVTFVDNIVTYGIWVVAAIAVLGGLVGAGKLAYGDEDGGGWLVKSALGLAIGLGIKGIAA